MNAVDLACLWGGIGLCAGLFIANMLWHWKIREKALSGFRLESGGKLYQVRECNSSNGDSAR